MKVVINVCFGGFGLSPDALLRLYELGYRDNACPVDKYFGSTPTRKKKESLEGWRAYRSKLDAEEEGGSTLFMEVYSPDEQFILGSSDIPRDNPLLVQVVEELGEHAAGQFAKLRVVDVPDDAKWEIDEYDGNEHVAESHRTWR